MGEYLNKRKKLVEILQSIEVEYDSDDCYHVHTLDNQDSKKLAEKILEEFGFNKPKNLK